MKKSLLFIILLPLLLLGCTNLDEINDRLDDHEARLSKLENLVANANTSISNIQKLVEAQSKKVTIVSYEALPDGSGYVLKMSDGTEITLNNGTDGQSPAIGVKDVDGLLYWTIDGELMRDAKGNPIQAEGQDGESGLTPKIRVNLEGYWEMSLDGGVSWQSILDENGAPVKAVGSDASVDLQITENDEAVTIVFNGQTFIIPKKGNTEPDDPEEPGDIEGTDLGVGANCYIVSNAGRYYFVPKKVSGTLIEGIASADWIWSTKVESGNTQELISDVKFSNGVISFSATGKKGSVLIAAFDDKGTVVWSWHIWCTEKPSNIVYENGLIFMDRNLGALEAGYSERSLGLLYQWGRKDPFYGGNEGEGLGEGFTQAEAHTIMNPKYEFAWTFVGEAANLETSIQNPTTFYAGEELDWIDVVDNTLWSVEKTDYDPSPAGYRLASHDDWGCLTRTNFKFDADKSAYSYTYNDATHWWPCDGVRDVMQNGELVKTTDNLHIWACTHTVYKQPWDPVTYYFGTRLVISPVTFFVLSSPGNKGFAQSVKCVVMD